jgi:VanZ family protein
MQRLFQVAAWALAGAIVFLSLSPASARPVTAVGHNYEHLLIFLATGAAFAFGYPRRGSLLLVAMLAFAGAVEVAQMWVPGRHARLSDFIIDVFSLYCGIGISHITLRLLKRTQAGRIR